MRARVEDQVVGREIIATRDLGDLRDELPLVHRLFEILFQLLGVALSQIHSLLLARSATRSITGPKLRFGFPFSVPLPTSTAMTRYLAVPSRRETGAKNTRTASGRGALPSQTIFTT